MFVIVIQVCFLRVLSHLIINVFTKYANLAKNISGYYKKCQVLIGGSMQLELADVCLG